MTIAAAAQVRQAAGWEVAQSARGILNAMETQDLTGFEQELNRAVSLSGRNSSDFEERCEVLQAIAEDLKSSVGRITRGVSSRLDAAHADVTLLHHLSRLPAVA